MKNQILDLACLFIFLLCSDYTGAVLFVWVLYLIRSVVPDGNLCFPPWLHFLHGQIFFSACCYCFAKLIFACRLLSPVLSFSISKVCTPARLSCRADFSSPVRACYLSLVFLSIQSAGRSVLVTQRPEWICSIKNFFSWPLVFLRLLLWSLLLWSRSSACGNRICLDFFSHVEALRACAICSSRSNLKSLVLTPCPDPFCFSRDCWFLQVSSASNQDSRVFGLNRSSVVIFCTHSSGIRWNDYEDINWFLSWFLSSIPDVVLLAMFYVFAVIPSPVLRTDNLSIAIRSLSS
jgi:hypothetical protein